MQCEKGYNNFVAYSYSKYANVLFIYALTRRLEGTGVTANAVHPGIARTGFGRDSGTFVKVLHGAMQLLGGSPEHGAQGVIYLAPSPEVAGITYDPAAGESLWEISQNLLVPWLGSIGTENSFKAML